VLAKIRKMISEKNSGGIFQCTNRFKVCVDNDFDFLVLNIFAIHRNFPHDRNEWKAWGTSSNAG
jgi:hypothetical protein